jgi:hypothetical protein
MPLSINVGLSRKASRDYQSQGHSINVTAELDQSLLARPGELQAQIADLYHQAQVALDRAAAEPAHPSPANGAINGQSHGRANGQAGSHTNGRYSRQLQTPGPTPANHNPQARIAAPADGPPLTASQKRAIFSIAHRLGLDPQEVCGDEVGCAIEDLRLRQASELIDLLKSLDTSAVAGGKAGGR